MITKVSPFAVSQIVDDAWAELSRSPSVRRQLGAPLRQFPDVSFAEAQRRSSAGTSLLNRLSAIDLSKLPHELALDLRAVRFKAQAWSREAQWYWTVTDPFGTGNYGMFLPTAYCGGLCLTHVNSQLEAFTFAESSDNDRYLSLVKDYARLIGQFTERTAEQATRGVRMPKVQVRQSRALLEKLKLYARNVILCAPQRISTHGKVDFLREIESRIATSVEPAFDRAIEGLSDAYLSQAPDAVGVSQYPDGPDIYAELVQYHTTLDLTPAQIHAYGEERLREIQEEKRKIRSELAFEGNDGEFVTHLNRDRRWFANSVDGVVTLFRDYMSRIEPRIETLFATMPKSPCEVTALPRALEGSMTYGYYEPPRKEHPVGAYRFNAANLTQQALFTLGGLTYHELIPGHHLHSALQGENEALHPFRQHSRVTAYSEGWAEYAATLAGEVGMYERAEERYGRLVNEAVLTSRLVVDTGMNALGWSLERARSYMREHSGISEAEILTETVRYSSDIPGQALAYKLGDRKIMQLREQMRGALGVHFDIKSFHAAILRPGAIPLPDLQWHVEHEIKRLRKESLV